MIFKGLFLKKKTLIAIGTAFLIFILAWITCILLFPVSIIDGEAYNSNKLKKLGEQRNLAYDELYASLNDEINIFIYNIYIKPVDNENDIEKNIIYNGNIFILDEVSKNNLYNLTNEELRILRNTFFAQYGYIFQSKDLSEHFNRFSWYIPKFNNVDEKLSVNDRKIIEMIREVENEHTNIDLQNILDLFYSNSINIDKYYYQLMQNSKIEFLFPLQIKKQYSINDYYQKRINIIEYNNQFYDEYSLKLFIEKYDYIISVLIKAKTDDIIEFIDFYSYYPDKELSSITDFKGYKYYYEVIGENIIDYYLAKCKISSNIMEIIDLLNVSLSDISILNIPFTEIDDNNYSSIAIKEINNSMEIVSPYLISKTKSILIKGINQQTEIYSNNINKYVDWYFSFITSIDKTITNVIGFFNGNKNAEEKYYLDNFNRIMNENADIYKIIEVDLEKHISIINYIFKEYMDLTNYFSVSIYQNTSNSISFDDYIEPYTYDIVEYFNNIFEALEKANSYNLQEYTIKENQALRATKTTAKILSGVNFFGGIAIDYLSLKAEQAINSSQLYQQIFDRMIENQNNKIAIINDPFNYLFDKLEIGSVIFVDNYFAGLNTYQHYGVYVGNEKVVHFAPLEGQEISAENGIIHETTLDKFLNGRALQIDMSIEKKYSDNEIIQRAYSRLGEKGYNLFTNNCEHFARWCVTGDNISYQVINSPQKLENTISVLRENYYMVSKFIELFK